MPYETSQGIIFSFNNVVYTATSILVSIGAGEINATSLNIPPGANCLSRFRPGGLKSIEAKVDWIGNTLPPTDAPYSISFGGTGPGSGTAMTGDGTKAIATGVNITAQAGELIRGTANFKYTVD